MYIDNMKWKLAILFVVTAVVLQAQAPQYLPGSRGHEINDRWDVLYWKTTSQKQHSGVGNISRKAVVYEAMNAQPLKGSFAEKVLEAEAAIKDSLQQSARNLYDGANRTDTNAATSIIRAGGITVAQGYSSKDEADYRYIIGDNVEYVGLDADNTDAVTGAEKVKKYEGDGVFYSIDNDDQVQVRGEDLETRAGTGSIHFTRVLQTFMKLT